MSECTHNCSSCSADCGSRDMRVPGNALSSVKRVIAGVSGTTPEFAPDPALPIDGFILDVTPDQSLCTLDADEIAQVEYWLYLEGCDPECYNPVQSRDAVLQLAFTSNPAEEEAKDELASDE